MRARSDHANGACRTAGRRAAVAGVYITLYAGGSRRLGMVEVVSVGEM